MGVWICNVRGARPKAQLPTRVHFGICPCWKVNWVLIFENFGRLWSQVNIILYIDILFVILQGARVLILNTWKALGIRPWILPSSGKMWSVVGTWAKIIFLIFWHPVKPLSLPPNLYNRQKLWAAGFLLTESWDCSIGKCQALTVLRKTGYNCLGWWAWTVIWKSAGVRHCWVGWHSPW